MAWNPSPEVAAARDYGKKFNADRVIIIHVNETTGANGYVTYGKTRALCDDTQRLGEAALSAVPTQRGEIVRTFPPRQGVAAMFGRNAWERSRSKVAKRMSTDDIGDVVNLRLRFLPNHLNAATQAQRLRGALQEELFGERIK